jgi:putative hydrolase of the HAD superfamily
MSTLVPGRAPGVDVLLMDLGGVVCRFRSAARLEALASAFGVTPAEVDAALFGSGFDHECDLGLHSPDAVLDQCRALGFTGTRADLEDAWCQAFEPDHAVLDLVRRARAHTTTALLTDNGPLLLESLPRCLPAVHGSFDVVLFSCLLGATKPDVRAFTAALERLRRPAARVAFVDDSARNVAAAAALGLRTHHYAQGHDEGPAALEDALSSWGLLG